MAYVPDLSGNNTRSPTAEYDGTDDENVQSRYSINPNEISPLMRNLLASVTPLAASLVLETLSIINLADTTLTVPSADYPDLNTAFAALDDYRIPRDKTATISLGNAILNLTASQVLDHPNADRVHVVGQDLLTRAFTSITSVSGAAGGYTVRLPIDNYEGIAVGNFFEITGTAGTGSHELLRGSWPISAISVGSYIEITVTAKRGTIPTGAVSGAARVYRSVLSFTGVSGLIFNRIGLLKNVAIRLNGVAGSFCIVSLEPNSFTLENVSLYGAGDDNISLRGGRLIAVKVFSCNAGNNGFNFRETSSTGRLTDCIASGNGSLANHALGGAGGFLGQGGGYECYGTCEAYGNQGDGFKQRTGGRALVDGAKASDNDNDFRAGQLGFMQALGISSKRANFSAYVDDGMLTITGTLANSLSNSVTVDGRGILMGQGIIITGATLNGVSLRGPGYADVRNANITCGGTAYIAAGHSGVIRSEGAAGATTRSPAVNTYDANHNTIRG